MEAVSVTGFLALKDWICTGDRSFIKIAFVETHSESEDGLRERVLSLAVACTFAQGNHAECPFSEVRKMDLGKRGDWVRGLSREEMLQLCAFHEKCLKETNAEFLCASGISTGN